MLPIIFVRVTASDCYRVATNEDIPVLAETLGWAFAFPPRDAEPWLRRAELHNVRMLERSGHNVACLLQIPMGQFFGGRSVPTLGVAGVATAAFARGTGAGIELMRRVVLEAHEMGIPLSTLYPASRSLYRKVGYEPAGSHLSFSIPIKNIPTRSHDMSVRPAHPGDDPNLLQLYRDHAQDKPGHLDRGSYLWDRVKSPRAAPDGTRGFVVGDLEGYAFFYEKRLPSLTYDLHVTDFVARTPAAYGRLLTLLADHGTLGESVVFCGTLSDPILQLLLGHQYSVGSVAHWMMRIVDVPRALEMRGYADRRAHVELEVTDDLVISNNRRHVLRIAGGRGTVSEGGSGEIRVDVRWLAPLYSGLLTARALKLLGVLEGEENAIARADAIFESPHPWMPDYF